MFLTHRNDDCHIIDVLSFFGFNPFNALSGRFVYMIPSYQSSKALTVAILGRAWSIVWTELAVQRDWFTEYVSKD